jgi:hypothetical protein
VDFGVISPPPAFRAGAAVLDFGVISPPPAFRAGAAVLDFGAVSELPPAFRISVLCVGCLVLEPGVLPPPAFRPAAAVPVFDAATGWYTGADLAATTPLPLNSPGLEVAAIAGLP